MPPPDSQATDLISVLIPAYNEERLIGQVIDSVRESFTTVGVAAYEIVVCDNNSTDQTAEFARAKGARVVFEPHNQISRARNAAAAFSRGKWLIFLDGDTQLNAPLLAATIAALSTGQICGGGTLVDFDRAPSGAIPCAVMRLWNWISSACQLAAGSYIFCRREAWAEVGGFDERVYAGEELYFSMKLKRWAKKRGLRFRILTDAAVVTSARKLEWYGPWELLWHMVRMARPWAIRRREHCGLWYSRPPGKEARAFPPPTR